MKKARVLLVDDEEPARRYLRRLLKQHDTIEIVGEASNAAEAVQGCLELQPDLLFMDITLPGITGFQILESIKQVPAVVFVSAHDHFAIKAFEVNAIDYLLKPVSPSRLAACLGKFQRHFSAERKQHQAKPLALKENGQIKLVNPADIVFLEAEGNYSFVHLATGARMLIHRSMNAWEEKLQGNPFIRLGRSLIINSDHLQKVQILSRDSGRIHLRGWEKPLLLRRAALDKVRHLMLGSRQ